MRLVLISLFLFPITSTTLLNSCEEAETCIQCANATDIQGVKCEWCDGDETCRSYILNTCPFDDRTPHPYGCPMKKVKYEVYDEDFTRDIVFPLIAATHSESVDQLQSVLKSCFKKVQLINTYTVVCDKSTNLTTCFAYLIRLPSRNAVALVFRGTVGLYQLIDEGISFFFNNKVPYKPTGGNVDQYYLTAFNRIWDSGMKADFEKQLEKHPDTEILCFGHSLGGGLASLAATHIAHFYKKPEVHLTTFGQPRIGDIDFAIGHDKLVPNSVRVINKEDPIPAMPPRSFSLSVVEGDGAFHHKFEIWYPFDMKRGAFYQVGRKADQFAKTSSIFHVLDHLNYFENNIQEFPEKGCRVKH